MKKLQRVISLVSLLTVLTSAAFAQEPNQRGRKGAGNSPVPGTGTITKLLRMPRCLRRGWMSNLGDRLDAIAKIN